MKSKQEHFVFAMLFNVKQVDVPVYRYKRYLLNCKARINIKTTNRNWTVPAITTYTNNINVMMMMLLALRRPFINKCIRRSFVQYLIWINLASHMVTHLGFVTWRGT